jgi:hypothetical protein
MALVLGILSLARSCQQDTGTETSSAVARLTVQRSRVNTFV